MEPLGVAQELEMTARLQKEPPVPVGTHVRELVTFALELLPTTLNSSGLYCFDRSPVGPARGESVRYSLMVLLGLQRAEAAGRPTHTDLGQLLDRCLDRRTSFTPGDFGLALWADARHGGTRGPDLLSDLDRAIPDDVSLAHLVGMEIGWLIVGLAHTLDFHPRATDLLQRVLGHLRRSRRAPSGLYYHDGVSHLRRRLPNFATEIYTLLALAVLSRKALDENAGPEAETLADHLLRMQLPDGGWPWLFDADRAAVVERYEIYSVHQDAMAPMALLELSEVTGKPQYAAAAGRGLAWSTGNNELGVNLLDRHAGFAHRSIRRCSPWDRVAVASNTAAMLATGRPLRLGGRRLELNATCRPYHLGWILEAWAGREGWEN